MKTTYNRIAGGSVERLAALSDGIFGVAMTLLLLDLKVPDEIAQLHRAGHLTEIDLLHGLLSMGPQVAVYLMSFVTLGIFWVGQQTQLNNLERSDRHLTWMTLAFLFAVTILPFTTGLLKEYIHFRVALLAYWLNILLLGALLYATWGRATRAKLVKDELTLEMQAAICRRIIVAQSLYAFGALLCVFGTFWSIGFIVLVQLNYAIAPRMWLAKSITE